MISNTEHHVFKDVLARITELRPDFLIAVTGDVHLNHPRVHSKRVIKHLEWFFNDELMDKLDVIIINGDLFDRRLAIETEDFTAIFDWIARFLRKCEKFKVKLIVLEGTRSHDHKQAQLLEFVNQIGIISADLKYIDKVDVWNLREDFPCLFIPDEVNYDASITSKEVGEVMTQYGLDTVKFSFMHGMFRYQAPIETPVSHNEDFYEGITEHRVVINHIHTPSRRGKIVAPGSPVRLRHGEEETKGFYLASIKDGVCEDWLIETENNVVWKTLDVTGLSFQDTCSLIDKFIRYENGSNFKLRMTRSCPVKPSIRLIKNQYPQFNFSEDFTDGKQGSLGKGEELVEHRGVRLNLTTEIIVEKIKERVLPIFDKDPDVVNLLDNLLMEI